MTRKTYPICHFCEHPLNPNGELCCPPCFKDYLLNELDKNMDLFADALGIPVLYTEGPNADI